MKYFSVEEMMILCQSKKEFFRRKAEQKLLKYEAIKYAGVVLAGSQVSLLDVLHSLQPVRC